MSPFGEYLDSDTRGRVPFVLFGWGGIRGWRTIFVIIRDMGTLEDPDGTHFMIELARLC